MKKFLLALPVLALARWFDRVRDEEVRAHRGRWRERQGDDALRAARSERAAHEGERDPRGSAKTWKGPCSRKVLARGLAGARDRVLIAVT